MNPESYTLNPEPKPQTQNPKLQSLNPQLATPNSPYAVQLQQQQTLITKLRMNRGTSLMRSNPLLGSYSRTIPRVLWWSWGEGVLLMCEIPL
jgi:hypothetical protein